MPFHLFSLTHGLAVLLSLVAVWAAWKLGAAPLAKITKRRLAGGSMALMAIIYSALTVSKLIDGSWTYTYNLPLHLCDISAWTIVYALVSRRQAVFEAGFYWGLVGGFMALLLPNLNRLDWYFVPFFIWHAFLVAAPLYMMRAYDLWPTRRGLYRSLAIAVLLGLGMMPLNALIGANYMFLNESIPSFEAMGLPAWPWYLPVLPILALGLFWLALLGSRGLHKLVKT